MKMDKMKTKVIELGELCAPIWDRLSDRYLLLSELQRRMFILFISVLGIALFYGLIWEPLKNWTAEWEQNFEIQRESYSWVEENAPIAKKLLERKKMNANQDLFNLCHQTSRRFGVPLVKLTPESKHEVAVSSKKVSYQKLLSWFSLLSKEHKVDFKKVEIKQLKEPGKVMFNAVLFR